MLFLGLFVGVMALGCAVYAIVALPAARISPERRSLGRAPKAPILETLEDKLVSFVDRVLRRRGLVLYSAEELELAGAKISQSSLVVTVTITAFIAFIVALTITGSLFMAFAVAVAMPFIAKFGLRVMASKRRMAFAEQLDATLQMVSSALRAGHSFPRALDTVSREAEAPTSEEFARIVNENRIGRDIVDAMRQTAVRTQSEDFSWVADAVAIQRETGGNLSEILDRVGETIRERAEIKAKIHSLSAEGRISAVVLMALPVVVGLAYAVINKESSALLVTTSIGRVLMGISAVLYIIAAFWLRALVKVKF